MKTNLKQIAICQLLSALCLSASAQGTAFTYQGRLNDGANPATGIYDLQFAIYDSTNNPGVLIAGPLTHSATSVSNGLFTVALDFGAPPFTGADRWLEIGARTNGSASFTTLNPRQRLTPTPYAITAASLADVVANNTVNAAIFDTIGGGSGNIATGNSYATIGGGVHNYSFGYSATIGGGYYNTNTGDFATVAGGAENIASGPGSFIGGGGSDGVLAYRNVASGVASSIVGGLSNNASAAFASVGGGSNNIIQAGSTASTINGGQNNLIQLNATSSTIPGGNGNVIQNNSVYSTIGGGHANTNSGFGSTVSGGQANTSSSAYSTVGGGENNTSSGFGATVGGGQANKSTANSATVSGGVNNTSSGGGAAVPGGEFNTAGGLCSFAAGFGAQALHDGTFVWADFQNATFNSTSSNQFLVRAQGGVGIGSGNPQGSLHVYSANNPTIVRIQSTGTPGFGRVEFVSNPQGDTSEWRPGFIQSTDNGGFTGGLGFFVNGTGSGNKFATNEVMRIVNGSVGIGTNAPQQKLHVIGNILASGTVTGSSDRNAKEHFAPVNPRDVLEKVSALPISRWNYKTESDVTHLGPMAQDFYAAFNVGMDDKHISMVDADGVALAAIQGLNEALEEQRAENAELKQRLEALEKLILDQKSN